ncbi:MAG: hypothetical protein BroJett041_23540 [Candidatus Jettenia caeni]|nr:MAG: hypothetical protein BroJett041_23540 [Candidatus Jettenia caeni]
MKLLTTLCFISGIFFSVFSHGLSCPNKVIDYKKFPGVKSEKDISRNQDSVGWCQSFVAADMLCYHFNKKANWTLKDQCSAADLKVNFEPDQDWLKNKEKSGSLSSLTIFGRYTNQGVCAESAFPSEFWNNQADGTNKVYEALSRLYEREKTEGRPSVDGLCPECAAISPNVTSKQIVEHVSKSNTGKEYIASLNKIACQGRRLGQGIEVKVNQDSISKLLKPVEKKDLLIAQIEKENPVYVSIEASSLVENAKGGHAVLAIGAQEMEIGNGRKDCFVILKNSWGRDCGVIKKHELGARSLSCDPNTGLLYLSMGYFLSKLNSLEWIEE